MKSLLVTGGAGFIGTNFIHYWIRRYPDDRVINLDALTYAGNLENLAGLEGDANYRFVHGDIADAELIAKIFEQESIDTVVNFAAESHVDRSIAEPETFLRTNILGTFTLLEAARQAWHGDRDTCRFVHVSTDEVYGSLELNDEPFSEKTPYAPNSPYSASKASSDHMARAWFHTYGLPVVTTNCSNNYGPFQFPEKLIPLTIINALEGKPLPVYGDGKNIRDWLYVEDHCQAIDAVLNRGICGEAYNIGGGNEWKNIDIVNQICHVLDQMRPTTFKRNTLVAYVKDRPGHDLRYAIDSNKLTQSLGWVPAHRFDDGLIKTIEWCLDNLEWMRRAHTGENRAIYQGQCDGS